MSWNFADVWETVADELPRAQALVAGSVRRSWRELDERADALADALLQSGVSRQQAVGILLRNRPEYLETVYACFKAALTPFNTHIHFDAEQLADAWQRAGATSVVFEADLGDAVRAALRRVPTVREVYCVASPGTSCPQWATPFDDVTAATVNRVRPPWERSGDDTLLIFTSGTTGTPKGVIWRQDDVFAALNEASFTVKLPENGTVDDVRAALRENRSGAYAMPASPLTHSTALFVSMFALSQGGSVVTVPSDSFDARSVVDVAANECVDTIAILGDAFARQMLRALDAHPVDFSNVRAIISSGVMWSEETKRGLLRHSPEMVLLDSYSSSEALGMASSQASGDTVPPTAVFTLSPHARLIPSPLRTTDINIGLLAVTGRQPVGYLDDPAADEATFVEVDGQRYSVPGDYARLESDGSVTVLGRGPTAIPVGDTLVFREVVEEAFKRHPVVIDALVVPLGDGSSDNQRIAAMVRPMPGEAVDSAELREHARRHLATAEVPSLIVVDETEYRLTTGKPDYDAARVAADAMDT